MARIGIDLDGVCYDFTGAFCRLQGWDPSTIKDWAFFEKQFGHTVEWFFGQCRDAIKSEQLFRYGDVIEGSVHALWQLVQAGHTLHVVTDRCSLDVDDTGQIIASTRAWWTDEGFPIYDSIHFTGDKAAVCKELELDYFLDDKISNIESVYPHVRGAWLFNQPWNADATHLPRAYTWDQFVGLITLHELMQEKGLQAAVDAHNEKALGDEVRVTSETGGQKGQKQARLGSLDPEALLAVAEVAGFGEIKYDRLNYMKGYDWSLSFDAGMRHRLAFWNGEDYDPESGLPHLAHSAWHDLCQLAFFLKGLGNDNRYPTWVKTLQEIVEAEQENVA